MKTTGLVAWIGATTGIASLGWNIYAKITANRPKLVAKAYANMILMPPPPKNPRYLKIIVQKHRHCTNYPHQCRIFRGDYKLEVGSIQAPSQNAGSRNSRDNERLPRTEDSTQT